MSRIHHLALVALLYVVVDTTETFGLIVVAGIDLVKPSCVIVEAIRDKIGYCGPLDLDSLGLYTRFQKCVVQTHGRL